MEPDLRRRGRTSIPRPRLPRSLATVTAMALVLALGLLVPLCQGAERPPSPGDIARDSSVRVVVISDVHFNPFLGLTRETFASLVAAPPGDWPKRLASQPPARIGTDAPWPLIRGCLEDARAQRPRPAFLLLPGDFLTHDWNAHYDQLAPRTRAEDPAAFDAFTTAVLSFLAVQIRDAFPDIPVFPVLGNEDSDCGDYGITPRSPFLRTVSELWAPLVFPEATQASTTEHVEFLRTFANGGFYSVPLPGPGRIRLIGLNTVFWTPQYRNACGSPSDTPGEDQFRWLESLLKDLSRTGEGAGLLMHVPPGIDAFATHEAGGTPQPLWRPDWTTRVLGLIRQHRRTVRFAIAGHLHMDDFRILDPDAGASGVLKGVPAVSPVYGNNPAYTILTWNPRRGLVTDYRIQHLPLRESGNAAAWKPEYEFLRGYPDAALTPAFLEGLAVGIRTAGPLQTLFRNRYSSGGDPTPVSNPILSCAIRSLNPTNFVECATP